MKLKKLAFNKIQATVFILSIFLAIIIAEYIFTYRDAGYGIVLCLFVTIAIYVLISVIDMEKSFINAAESLAIIPLYVLFTSSLPWFFIDQQFLLPAIYSIILALCFWHMHETNLELHDVGLKGNDLLKMP